MGTLRFFEEVVSFKIRRTFGFADYTGLGVPIKRSCLAPQPCPTHKKVGHNWD